MKSIFHREPTPQEAELINSVFSHRYTAVKSGHGTGKTTSVCHCGLLFMLLYPHAKVIATSVNDGLLSTRLWVTAKSELSRSIIAPLFDVCDTPKRIRMTGEDDWFFIAESAERAHDKRDTALGGHHADNMLIIIDEASGVEPHIFDSLLFSMSGRNNHIVVTGNPLRSADSFYDIFIEKHDMWNCLTFNAEESPIVSRETIDAMAREYGRDSDEYRMRVLGEFPRAGGYNIMLPIEKLELCRTVEPQSGPINIGVDVARFGNDNTCIAVVRGNELVEVIEYNGRDTVETANIIISVANRYHKLRVEMNVTIDDTGVGGGVTDNLRDRGYDPIAINFGARSYFPDKYANTITEIFANFSEKMLDKRIRIAHNDNISVEVVKKLFKQLSCRRYEYTPGNVKKIESKDKVKERIGHSPDLADAVLLGYFDSYKRQAVLRDL